MAGQLIGTAKALGTAGKLARVRFLSGMGTNMAGLMLQTVESTVTERALVGARQILAHLIGGRTGTLHQGREKADGRGHSSSRGSSRRRRSILKVVRIGRSRLGIEQIREIH